MQDRRLNAAVLGASVEGGTGWAIADLAARHNMHVTVGARRIPDLERLAAAIGGKAAPCDAMVEQDVSAFADAAVEAGGGPIDVAILAAGAGVHGTIDAISPDDLQRAFALNYFAPVYFIRHMARRMAQGGAIVLISSISATNAWPGYFAYGCAKAAMQTLVQYAALELGPRGIRVNAVCPGPIQTPSAAPMLENAAARVVMDKEIPLGRPVLPQEVAEAILWFAKGASGVTGECVHVDGGMHLRRPPDVKELSAAMRKGAA